MSEQMTLLDDRWEDAAVAAVMQLGGYKAAARHVYPEIEDVERAAGRLRDALNPDRRDQLSVDRQLRLMRAAREAGYHGLMLWWNRHAGYSDPQPITRQDEAAELMKRFVAAAEVLGPIADRLAELGVPASRVTRGRR